MTAPLGTSPKSEKLDEMDVADKTNIEPGTGSKSETLQVETEKVYLKPLDASTSVVSELEE